MFVQTHAHTHTHTYAISYVSLENPKTEGHHNYSCLADAETEAKRKFIGKIKISVKGKRETKSI